MDPNGEDPGAGKLREQLRFLEESYPSQPPVVRQEDLEQINRLRAQLGLPLVDEQLVEPGPVEPAPTPEAESKTEGDGADPHLEARALHQEYLRKLDELQRHREYADRVAEATAGQGMTPVRPLATMGTGGGPLLCDHCEKPIRLEGGRFHGKAADLAWREHPNPPQNWASYILGGLVIEIETNRTLRIYHGYPGRRSACCGRASAADDEARREFDSGSWFAKESIVADFVREELLPGADPAEQQSLAHRILDTLFGYDPGVGVNRP